MFIEYPYGFFKDKKVKAKFLAQQLFLCQRIFSSTFFSFSTFSNRHFRGFHPRSLLVISLLKVSVTLLRHLVIYFLSHVLFVTFFLLLLFLDFFAAGSSATSVVDFDDASFDPKVIFLLLHRSFHFRPRLVFRSIETLH